MPIYGSGKCPAGFFIQGTRKMNYGNDKRSIKNQRDSGMNVVLIIVLFLAAAAVGFGYEIVMWVRR